MASVIFVSSSAFLAASVRPSQSLAVPPGPADVGLSSASIASISAWVGASASPVTSVPAVTVSAVVAVFRSSASYVSGPTIPSASSPFSVWNASTATRVAAS